MNEISPYRDSPLELELLREENRELREIVAVRGLGFGAEIGTAACFAMSGVCLISMLDAVPAAAAAAWIFVVGGMYGLIKLANRRSL